MDNKRLQLLDLIEAYRPEEINALPDKERTEIIASLSKYLLAIEPGIQKKMYEYIDSHESKDIDLHVSNHGQGYESERGR